MTPLAIRLADVLNMKGIHTAYLHIMLLDIHKPGSLHRLPLQLILDHREGALELALPLKVELPPLTHGGLVSNGAIVALHKGRHLKALEPSAWLEGQEGVFKQGGPAIDAP